MGNTVPRAGLEPKSLAFRTRVLPLHYVGYMMSPLCPCPPVCVVPCLRGQCRILDVYPWNCKSFIAYNYIIHEMVLHILTC